MAESGRDPDPNAPQNPPKSVLNKNVRRSALWTYLTPLVIFFAGVTLILAYWGTSPPVADRNRSEPAAQGTTGTERARAGERTPGGHNPDRDPATTESEIEDRAGRPITRLGDIFEEGGRNTTGRRVEIVNVRVERAESPTLFWIRDGDARIAVVAPAVGSAMRTGETVKITGTVERSGNALRIRASRVDVGS